MCVNPLEEWVQGWGVSVPQACTCSFSASLIDRHGTAIWSMVLKRCGAPPPGLQPAPRIWPIHQRTLLCPIPAPATPQEENKEARMLIPTQLHSHQLVPCLQETITTYRIYKDIFFIILTISLLYAWMCVFWFCALCDFPFLGNSEKIGFAGILKDKRLKNYINS